MTRHVVAMLTSFNRRSMTVDCIDALLRQKSDVSRLDIVLVDDGSTDGTAAAIAKRFPSVEIVPGGGLYWARGMARAESVAATLRPDYFLWVNDDAALGSHAIASLISCAESEGRPTIVVGSVVDPETSSITYGGLKIRSRMPLRLELVGPVPAKQFVDTFNGNLVLVPAAAARTLVGIDSSFGHHYADWDYGLRASKLGIPIVVAPGILGTTARNSPIGTYHDATLSRGRRLRLLLGPKGLPPRDQARFLARHGGPLWQLQWAWAYFKFACQIAVAR